MELIEIIINNKMAFAIAAIGFLSVVALFVMMAVLLTRISKI